MNEATLLVIVVMIFALIISLCAAFYAMGWQNGYKTFEDFYDISILLNRKERGEVEDESSNNE